MLVFLFLVLYKYQILSIMSQALHIIEEFSKIQCCYFGTEKELATLFPTRYLFQMVILAYIRWNSFYAITKSRIIFEFLAAHAERKQHTDCFVSYKNSFSVHDRLDIGGLLFPLR